MIEWIEVMGSDRIVAEAYDVETETIYVRFPNGVEYWYASCPPEVWEAFTAPGQSGGRYIREHLDYKPRGRYGG